MTKLFCAKSVLLPEKIKRKLGVFESSWFIFNLIKLLCLQLFYLSSLEVNKRGLLANKSLKVLNQCHSSW